MYASLPQYSNCPPCKLTFDLLTLKVVSESRVTWAICVPILVFLGRSVLELFQMYATNVRQIDVRHHHRLMPPPRVPPPRGHYIITYD